MANANCVANVPRGHKFGLAVYGAADQAVYTRRLAFIGFDLKEDTETAKDEGITDNLWEQTGDEVIVAKRVSGQVSLNPRAEDLQDICLGLFGGANYVTNAKLPGNVCEYYALGHADPKVDRIYNYSGLVTTGGSFSAREKGLLNLQWNIEGQQRTLTTGVSNFPSLSLSTQQPFAMRQGVLTIAGGNRRFKNVVLSWDNGIQATDWFNSLTRGEMPSAIQTFTLTHDSPWDTATDVDTLGTIKEAAAVLEFTSGTKKAKFEFPRLFGIDFEPAISGTTRIMKGYSWRAKYVPGDAIAAPVKITIIGT